MLAPLSAVPPPILHSQVAELQHVGTLGKLWLLVVTFVANLRKRGLDQWGEWGRLGRPAGVCRYAERIDPLLP